jgi:hypothetical protein
MAKRGRMAKRSRKAYRGARLFNQKALDEEFLAKAKPARSLSVEELSLLNEFRALLKSKAG